MIGGDASRRRRTVAHHRQHRASQLRTLGRQPPRQGHPNIEIQFEQFHCCRLEGGSAPKGSQGEPAGLRAANAGGSAGRGCGAPRAGGVIQRVSGNALGGAGRAGQRRLASLGHLHFQITTTIITGFALHNTDALCLAEVAAAQTPRARPPRPARRAR